VVWEADEWAELLGFNPATSLTGDDEYVSDWHAQCLWLPNCGPSAIIAPHTLSTTRYGKPETDASFSKAPSGASRSMAYSRRYGGSMEFRHVLGSKAWIEFEEIPQESFEQFWTDTVGYGKAIRYYPDRANDTGYQDWAVENFGEFLCRFNFEGWTGAMSTSTIGPYILAKLVTV
jgi:hypothetical protein